MTTKTKEGYFYEIGLGIFVACIGATFVIGEVSNNRRAEECDKRGGMLVKVADKWAADKHCLIKKDAK